MLEIIGSEMVFGTFKEENVFQIEQSQLHNNVGKGIKTVEFILLKNEKKLFFIEAKSSSPRPSKEDNERFEVFISEISDKFIHSLYIFSKPG